MKAVADALAVDRKALHRYVGDRGDLVELVVADMFEAQLGGIDLPPDAAWQETLHFYGKALRDGVVRLGTIASQFQLRGGIESKMLPWAERVLQSLLRGGFEFDEAASTLQLVAGVAISAGHDATLIAETRVHPHHAEVARALQNLQPNDYPVFVQVIAAREIDTPVERDFEFDMRVIIADLENLLSSKAHPV